MVAQKSRDSPEDAVREKLLFAIRYSLFAFRFLLFAEFSYQPSAKPKGVIPTEDFTGAPTGATFASGGVVESERRDLLFAVSRRDLQR